MGYVKFCHFAMQDSLNITIHSDLHELTRMQDEVTRFCEKAALPAQDVYSLQIILEESVSNVIKYAFQEGEQQSIHIYLSLENNTLHAVVRDNGREFNPLNAPPPDLGRPIDQWQPGGLGIHLIRSLTEHVEYARIGNENCFTMHIKIGGSERTD
jgi:anti-sigma regulatory factor (Ser/Thr protein kinase)